MAEVIGTVARVFSNKGNWSAGVLTLAEGGGYAGKTSCKFAGSCCLAEGDEVILRGEWIRDPKWGRQFDVKAAGYVDSTENGGEDQGQRALISFLKSNRDFKHIGEVRARKLVKLFGGIDGLGDALLQTPQEVVDKVPGLTAERVEALAAQWAVSYLTLKYEVELMQFGLSPRQARSVVASFGTRTLEVLEENPWLVYLEVPEIPWTKVDAAALARGFAADHPFQVHARAVWTCRDAARDGGHTWVSGDPKMLQAIKDTDLELPKRYIDIIDRGKGEIPRYAQALHDLACAEAEISNYLWLMHPEAPRLQISTAPRGKSLTTEQRAALEAAARHRMLIITGGAGTGKTYTAEAIIDAYEAAGGKVILAAPTGKAAKRLTEATGRPASTIHRLMLTPPELAELREADLLLIDEVSMVDSALLGWVLKELTERTSLILMGDANQLPPVQAGNPLRDLLLLEDTHVVELSQVHRCAGDLKDCCGQVLEGKVAPDAPGAWEVHTTGSGSKIVAKLEKVISSLEAAGYAFPEDVQVLSPMKKGEIGTVHLNQVLRERHQGEGLDPEGFTEGDRVIQTKNNYALGVYNGETGRVLRTYPDEPARLLVEIDGKVVEYAPYTDKTGSKVYPTNDLQFAYALTVHKTQGSEYPAVVLLLDNYHVRLLHRNLLYTGVTRAREVVHVITTRSAMASAAKTVVKDQRRTLLV